MRRRAPTRRERRCRTRPARLCASPASPTRTSTATCCATKPPTSAWYYDQSASIDAASREAFELVQLTVNGKDRTIRRTERKATQLYTASLGRTAINGQSVTVAYTYRVLAQRHGHVLYLDLPRPTKGLKVQFSYGDAGIRRVTTLDFIAGPESARVQDTPASVPARTVTIGFDGWIFPRSGVPFL